MYRLTDSPRASAEEGSALVLALLVTVLLASLGVGLVTLGDTEQKIANGFRAGADVLYAADGAAEAALAELQALPSFTPVLAGQLTSSFVQAAGPLAPAVDLAAMTGDLQAESDASTSLGGNRPAWQIFSHGPLSALVPAGAADRHVYVVTWLADDPNEVDGDPRQDANGQVRLLARAIGPGGARRTVELVIARDPSSADDELAGSEPRDATESQSSPDPQWVHVLSWKEIR